MTESRWASVRSVVIEADGGSRGNPGPAAYGAVLKDAETGEVIAEDGTTIGEATNNVAEYSGLIAGLRMARDLTPDAEIAVRMDSKLVVEQMSGRWKIKHPAMRPLAVEANGLAPFGTTYTWVPRELNKHADRLANEALDGERHGVTVAGELPDDEEADPAPAEPAAQDDSPVEEVAQPSSRDQTSKGPVTRGWGGSGAPTTLVLVRHGVTVHTAEKRFSGGLASANPGLSDEGREQVRTTADWLAPMGDRFDALLSSPVRRTVESAEILAERLGREIATEPGFAEMEFGVWDGLTFDEVATSHADDLDAWLGSLDAVPGEVGESFRVVEKRVLDALEATLDAHAGGTVVVVSHVTPIKTLVAHALQAPLQSVFRMELAPASVSCCPTSTGVVTSTSRWPPCGCSTAGPPGRRWTPACAESASMGTSESDGASPRPSDVAGRSAPAERPRALTGALWTIVALVAWTLVLELVIPLATGELVAAYPDGPSDAVVVAESVIGAAGGVALWAFLLARRFVITVWLLFALFLNLVVPPMRSEAVALDVTGVVTIALLVALVVLCGGRRRRTTLPARRPDDRAGTFVRVVCLRRRGLRAAGHTTTPGGGLCV
ncbi:bifunctional RNase H/acid phosphatase [Nocardioides sp.]|uniref:bifunctional RNase H/acid phosphatase n=1 Tax=Nocardioides sp. TaxID=35761 RepID=UPI003528BC6D